MVEEVLLEKARQKQLLKMMEMGIEIESEEAQAALSPEQLKTLPEIEKYQNAHPLKTDSLETFIKKQNQLLNELKNLK